MVIFDRFSYANALELGNIYQTPTHAYTTKNALITHRQLISPLPVPLRVRPSRHKELEPSPGGLRKTLLGFVRVEMIKESTGRYGIDQHQQQQPHLPGAAEQAVKDFLLVSSFKEESLNTLNWILLWLWKNFLRVLDIPVGLRCHCWGLHPAVFLPVAALYTVNMLSELLFAFKFSTRW